MNRKILLLPALCLLLHGCAGGVRDLDCNDQPEQCKNTGPAPAPSPAPQGDGSAPPVPAYPPAPTSCCPVDGPHHPGCPVC